MTRAAPFLQLATRMALDGNCTDMTLNLFKIPLLIFGFPYLSFAALATGEWPIEIKIGKGSVRVDVRELPVIGCHR